jgi:hypothetical protein
LSIKVRGCLMALSLALAVAYPAFAGGRAWARFGPLRPV